jgi:hypothetical protein
MLLEEVAVGGRGGLMCGCGAVVPVIRPDINRGSRLVLGQAHSTAAQGHYILVPELLLPTCPAPGWSHSQMVSSVILHST